MSVSPKKLAVNMMSDRELTGQVLDQLALDPKMRQRMAQAIARAHRPTPPEGGGTAPAMARAA